MGTSSPQERYGDEEGQGSCRSGKVMENWNIRENINGHWEVRDSQENR